MNEKSERLKKAINYLKMAELIEKDADVAKKMGADVSNVSRSKKEQPTDKFIVRFCDAFPDISKTWLMTGEGEMLTSNAVTGNNNTVGNINSTDALLHAIDEIAAQRKMVEKSQQQIDELLQQQRLLIETIAKKT